MSSKKHSSPAHHPRQSRTVLSEEEYTSTLNDIVQRDYFPDLPSLRRQAAVLEKRSQGDFAGAVAVRRAARQLEQHEQSLAEEEHEAEQNVDADNVRKTPRPLHRETLSGFHARATSEDNAEFDATQRQEVQTNRARLQQVFSLQISNGTTQRGQGSETPLLASDKFNPSPHRIAAKEWKDNETGSNGLFFNPQHYDGAFEASSQQKLLTNGKGAASTESQLMPPPAPVKRSSDTSSALVLKQDKVEYIPKTQVEKQIDPSKTRFPVHVSLPPQRPSTGDSSTDYSTEASTDLDAPALPLSVERQARAKRQRREQETFVSMTPQIVPGRSAGNESPIVTWGTVSATPMVIGGRVDDVCEKSFRLPAESDRDQAARRVGETFEKARRKTNQRSSRKSSTPMDQLTASLTPAARSLLNKSSMRQPSSVRSRNAFGTALRSSYTPKRGASASSLKRDHAGKATPRVQSGSKRTVDTTTSGGNITDGLLKLPPKAPSI